MKIGVIVASNRPNRKGTQIAAWVKQHTDQDPAAEYTYLDLDEIGLPFLNEPDIPMMGNYQQPHTLDWSEKVGAQDSFLLITPEYNHGYPAALKNALDTLFAEWNNKPVGFVGYGSSGGIRAIEQLALVALNLQMVPLTASSTRIFLGESLDKEGNLVTDESHEQYLRTTLDDLKAWTRRLLAGKGV